MTILKLTDRKNDIRAAGPGAYFRSRIAEAADALSLAGSMASRVELCNEALSRLVVLAYEPDTDGRAANVDTTTHRILIPLPWGSSGWRAWGLRYHEALVMRAIMLGRQGVKPGGVVPLFVYDAAPRTWHLNVQDYRGLDAGLAWLQASQITLSEWRRYLRQYRNDAATGQKSYRNGIRNNGATV